MTDRAMIEQLEAQVRALNVELQETRVALGVARAEADRLRSHAERAHRAEHEALEERRRADRAERNLGAVMAAKEIFVVHECEVDELALRRPEAGPTERPPVELEHCDVCGHLCRAGVACGNCGAEAHALRLTADASQAGPEVSPSPQAADDAQASGPASGAASRLTCGECGAVFAFRIALDEHQRAAHAADWPPPEF